MSTNNLRTSSITSRGGLKPILTNRNISNLQTGKNIMIKPSITSNNNKKLAQSTNTLNHSNLNSKPTVTSNILKKPLVSITESENSDVTKDESKLGSRKSKIPKFSSPIKPSAAKQLKKEPVINKPIEPKLSVKNLLSDANLVKFSSFVIPDTAEDIDVNDHTNVLLAPGFSNDIYMYLNHLEEKLKLKADFLQIQKQMNHKMRARLVDWIVAAHHKFKLLPETLYLTIAIMDHFFEKVNVTKDKVQLVGVTAFFIACKYEEIYPPEITDFIKLCETYEKNEILKMEKTILKTLNFVLSYPLPLHFLRRYSKAAHADQEIHTLAKYLMELGIIDYECSNWKPSLLASASLYLTLHILASDSKKKQWTETLVFYTGYKESDLLKHVSHLSRVLLGAKDSKLQTVKSKYSNFKLLRISEHSKLTSEYVVKMSKISGQL